MVAVCEEFDYLIPKLKITDYTNYTWHCAANKDNCKESKECLYIFHLLCCEWSSIFTLTKVNARRKIIFTVGESTSSSWMCVFDGILNYFIDQFEGILCNWFFYQLVTEQQ